MLKGIYSLQLCKPRFAHQMIFVKEFKKASGISKWTLKSRDSLHVVSDTVPSSLGLKALIKPFIFTVTFSGSCFVAASIWQYEEMLKRAHRFMNMPKLFDPHTPKYKRFELRRQLNSWWNRQTEGQKVAAIIAGINLFVFCLWRIPSCYPVMRKYFCSSPALEASCLPMILSTFSHYSFFHLAANMYVLYSFSTTAVAYFGKEQFLAMYGSAAVFSSFTSYLHKITTGTSITSLGASGALMAILASMCVQYPDTPLQIVFLPFFTFSAGHALKAVMTLDLIGLLAKWKLFDHAAHLGGAAFGIAYLLYGQDYIWSYRQKIFSWYHKIRSGGVE